MRLKLNTMILLLIAVLFGGGVWIWEHYQGSQPDPKEQEAIASKLFDFSEDQVKQLTVSTPNQSLAFKLSQQGSPPKTTWVMTAPQQVNADEAAIAFLLNLMATSRIDQTLNVPVARLQEFGLDQPQGTIEVTLNTQQTHKIVLGNQTFNQSAVYAQVDPPHAQAELLQVDLLPTSFLDAIERPLAEWEQRDEQTTPTDETAQPDPN